MEFVLRVFKFASSNLSRNRAGYFFFASVIGSQACKRWLMIERLRNYESVEFVTLQKQRVLDGTIGHIMAWNSRGFWSLGHFSISISVSISHHFSSLLFFVMLVCRRWSDYLYVYEFAVSIFLCHLFLVRVVVMRNLHSRFFLTVPLCITFLIPFQQPFNALSLLVH